MKRKTKTDRKTKLELTAKEIKAINDHMEEIRTARRWKGVYVSSDHDEALVNAALEKLAKVIETLEWDGEWDIIKEEE